MSFKERVLQFDYKGAVAVLGITGRDHLWAKLVSAGRHRPALEEAQMVHDISWFLTQIDADRRRQILLVYEKIKKAVTDAYGPLFPDFYGSLSQTLEGFAVPLAKVPPDGWGLGQLDAVLRPLFAGGSDVPSPRFAALFAKHWLWFNIVKNLPEERVTQAELGQRKFLGWRQGCTACNGKPIAQDRVKQAIETARERAITRARRGSSNVAGIPESLMNKLRGFIGNPGNCASCGGDGVDRDKLQEFVEPYILWHSFKGLRPNILHQLGIVSTEGLPVSFEDLRPSISRLLENIHDLPGVADCIEHVQGRYKVDIERLKRVLGPRRHLIECDACGGTGGESNWKAALATPLPGETGKTVRDLLNASDAQGGLSGEALIGLFGKAVACPHCTVWLKIPAKAKTNWVCPVINLRGERVAWLRLVVTPN